MADHNISITNSFNVFGLAETNKWGVFNWNAFLWGEGNVDLVLSIGKVDAIGTLSLDSSISTIFQINAIISNDLSVTADMYSESLSDGSGYNYVFPGGVTNAENRVADGFTAVTPATSSWSTASIASTSWAAA